MRRPDDGGGASRRRLLLRLGGAGARRVPVRQAGGRAGQPGGLRHRQELRDEGGRGGDREPIWEALVKCPKGVYVKRDFRWYEVLSRMMLEVVRDLSPRVEYYSIDEFFFLAAAAARADVPGAGRGDPRPDLGAGRGAGDGRHRPDADPGQADLRRGQAVRGPGGARRRGGGGPAGRRGR